MDDQVGLIVMLGIVVLLAIGFVMVAKQRSAKRGGDGTESWNGHVSDTVRARADHPEGAERSHLVGNPPVDTVTTEGWGVATPGEGAMEELPVDVHPDLHDSDRRRRGH